MANASPTARFKVFISYARHDGVWRDRVKCFLACLPKSARIEVWSDENLRPGNDWLAAIERETEAACVAVLVVTEHFLASEFIKRKEVPRILRRQRKDGMIIYPLLVRQCPHQLVKWLRALHWRPSGKKCLEQMRGWERARELTALALDIDKIVRERART